MLSWWGGAGLVEKMDIVAELRPVEEFESLYHGPVDSDTVVRADSLANLACFVGEGPWECLCDGTARFGLLGDVV